MDRYQMLLDQREELKLRIKTHEMTDQEYNDAIEDMMDLDQAIGEWQSVI